MTFSKLIDGMLMALAGWAVLATSAGSSHVRQGFSRGGVVSDCAGFDQSGFANIDHKVENNVHSFTVSPAIPYGLPTEFCAETEIPGNYECIAGDDRCLVTVIDNKEETLLPFLCYNDGAQTPSCHVTMRFGKPSESIGF